MNAQHLSKRLAKVAQYVPQNARLADIGSDHAYLPVNLALNGKINYGIAGEVVEGPFKNACHEIKKENLTTTVIPRLADGLAAINDEDRIDTVTICGMGGTLIKNILEKGKIKLRNHPLLILQPNVGSNIVRKWLFDNHYVIQNEEILEEENHIYEIIIAYYTLNKSICPSIDDLLFGKQLRLHQNKAFKHKWEQEINKNQQAISQMKQAKKIPHQRIKQLIQLNKHIKEVLQNDKSK